VAAATQPPATGAASTGKSPAPAGASAPASTGKTSAAPAGAPAPASTSASPGKPSSSPSAPAGKSATGTAPTPGATKKGSAAGSRTPPPAKPKPRLNDLQEIDWSDLLPEPDRKKYNPNAPAPVHGPLGEGGPPAVQVVTNAVNPDLEQQLVKLPGFIVPIGEPRNGVVHEFYLVPYIGEDIHVPPPPSNQMVYVHSAAGVATEALHEAYWVTGKIRIETRTTPLGTSAYSLVANKVEQYQY
jgi:hypothetical protein